VTTYVEPTAAAIDRDSRHRRSLLASRVAVTAAAQAIQICGAQGTLESQPFGRYLRDAKAYEIAMNPIAPRHAPRHD
jgi:alkylation response protein AidB-like acyl-CoA dehydrogenase